jgi:hypothetical protein
MRSARPKTAAPGNGGVRKTPEGSAGRGRSPLPANHRLLQQAAPARSTGQAIDPGARSTLENAYDADLGSVKVNTDAHAAAAAASIQADAYTSGRDIYFAAGRYRPATSDGMHLLAHEAAHTLQQGSGNPGRILADESLESEAHAAADGMVSAGPGGSISQGVAAGVQRSISVDVLHGSFTPAAARDLTDAELEAQINLVRGHLAALTASTPESAAIQENLNVLENEARRRTAAAAPARQARAPTPRVDVSAADSTPAADATSIDSSSTQVLAAGVVAPLGLPGGGGARLGGLPESAFRFGQIAGETPLNPTFAAGSDAALGTTGTVAETAGVAGEAALGVGETAAAVVETAALTTAAEETAAGGAVLAAEGAIPVAGWIALGVTVAAIGIYLGARYLLSDEQRPVRPLTPDEGQRVLPPTPVPHQAPGPEGQNSTPAVEPGSGERLYTPGQPHSGSGIDPATGEHLYTPGQQSDEPAEAASSRRRRREGERHYDEDDPRSDPERNQRISDANKAELEASGWLRAQLPDPEDRRAFMEWLQRRHETGEEHVHLSPGSPEAQRDLNEWQAETGR